MPSELPFGVSNRSLQIEQFFALPSSAYRFSWDGVHRTHPARFFLALDPERIWFGARCPGIARCHPDDSLGAFVKGLWEFDVAELFIKDDRTNAYQEFNLGPRGAWWSALFSSNRVEEGGRFKLPNVITASRIDEREWSAAMGILRSSLSIQCSCTPASRMNVCFINGENEKNYLSFAEIHSPQPDFHRAEFFAPLKLEKPAPPPAE